jgi:hypothetical protein
MSADLYRLVYVSTNEITGDLTEVRREIDRILSVARDRNAAAGVTGALLFNGGRFAQVLEGPMSSVERIFERIQVDLRHSAVNVLDFRPIAVRWFSEWSMGYLGPETGAARRFADIATSTGFDPDRLDGEHVFEVVRRHLLETGDRAG